MLSSNHAKIISVTYSNQYQLFFWKSTELYQQTTQELVVTQSTQIQNLCTSYEILTHQAIDISAESHLFHLTKPHLLFYLILLRIPLWIYLDFL